MSQRKQSRFGVSGGASAAVLAAVWAGAMSGGGAYANTYSWTGATGNFTTAANWTGGVAPTGLSATDTLVFGTANAYTATNNTYTAATRRQFYLGTMLLNDPSAITVIGTGRKGTTTTTTPGSITVYAPFRFITGNGLIDQQGTGTADVAAPINIGPGGSLTIQAEAGSGQLTLANLTSPATLQDNFQFQGEGILNFNNLSSNPILAGNMAQFRGPINVLAGTVALADSPNTATAGGPGNAAGDSISGLSLITIASGATFDFNGNSETFGGIAGAGTVNLGTAGGMNFTYDKSNLTFSGNITQTAGGTGGFNKLVDSGHTTYTWTGNAQMTGASFVNGGGLVLSGNGQISAASSVTVNNGSSLTLDNSGQNLSGRLNPAMTLGVGGTVSLLAAPGAATTENVNVLTIGGTSGEGTVNVVNGSGGGTATLTANSLAISSTVGGFVNFTGNGSVLVTNAPALTNGIIGQSVVNYADWATTDPNNGNKIIPLPAGSYQTSADPTTWVSSDNVKVAAALTASADAATSTVNSLLLSSATTTNIGTSLTLATGGILATDSATVTGGQINSGSGNGQFTAAVAAGRTLTINSNIVDGAAANVLVKAGPGTLVLGGSNSFNGGVVLQSGTLQVASDAALGGSGGLTLNGGTLQFTADATTARNLSLNGLDAAIDTGPNNVTFAGTFGVGNTGSLTKLGPGTLTLGLFKTSGNLDILAGTVITASTGDTFGNGTMIHIAAGATMDLSYDAGGENFGMMSGEGTLKFNATSGMSLAGPFDNATFSGILVSSINGVPTPGAGTVDINATGSITLSGPSTYTSQTRIQTGTVIVTADAIPNTDGPLGNSSTLVQLGFSPGGSYTEPDMVAQSQLFIGAPGVTIGRDLTIVDGASGPNGTVTGVVTIGTTHTSGSSTFSGAIAMARTTELSVAGSSTASLTGVISGNGDLVKTGSGTAVLTNPANIFKGGFYVQSGTVLLTDAGAASTGTLNISGGMLTAQAGLTGPLQVSGVTLSDQGRLDLNDNDMIIAYTTTSPLASIQAAIARAYASGAWTGTGLTSSTALAGGIESLGTAEAAALGVTSFDGVSVTNAVLIKYTYFGDLNLDGRVNGDDYALADRSLAKGGLPGTARWIDGDVNYDGVVNAQDYLLIDKSMALQGGIVLDPSFLAMRESEFGSGYVSALVASVPEPTSLALLAGGSLGLFSRRRRS